MENRSKDLLFEKITTEYTKEEHALEKRFGIKNPEFITDRDRQLQGCDVIWDFNGKQCVGDFKAVAVIDLNTFTHEVGNMRPGKFSGWQFNEKSKTTHLIYSYFDVGINDYKKGKDYVIKNGKSVIRKAKYIIVEKKKIDELIWENLGLKCDTSTAMALFNAIRHYPLRGKSYFLTGFENNQRVLFPISEEEKKKHDMYITVSAQLPECPVNVLIKRGILSSLGCDFFEENHEISAEKPTHLEEHQENDAIEQLGFVI